MVGYRRYTDFGGNIANFKLIDADTNAVIDTLKFHSFTSVVLAFDGYTQSVRDVNGDGRISDPEPGDPGNFEGILDVAQDLYETGWNVFPYDYWDVDEDQVGKRLGPLKQVKNSVDGNAATGVAVFGYSLGGGATYDLVSKLNKAGYNVNFTGYVDAIHYNSGMLNEPSLGRAVDDYPPGADFLLNQFETNSLWVDGTDVEATGDGQVVNIDTTNWTPTLYHTTIDDDSTVQQNIKTYLDGKIDR